jgi:hypothetical protein
MPPGRDPHWKDADIDWDAGTVRDDWGEAGPRHRVLLIHRLALRRFWPSGSTPADAGADGARATSVTTGGALPRPTMRDDELRRWYAERVKKSEPTSEAADWEAARLKFGQKVRRNQVRNLRRELAPNGWRRQGRRGKPAANSAE